MSYLITPAHHLHGNIPQQGIQERDACKHVSESNHIFLYFGKQLLIFAEPWTSESKTMTPWKNDDKMSTAATAEQATAMENFDDDEEEENDEPSESESHTGSSMRSSDGLSAPNHNNESDDDELKQVQEFARNEDRRVFYSRALVAFAILAVGACVSSLTYVILHAQVRANSQNAVSQESLIRAFDATTFAVTRVSSAYR